MKPGYSQCARLRSGFRSRWKWLRCCSFASGPRTVSNSRQAPSWMVFRKLVAVVGFGSPMSTSGLRGRAAEVSDFCSVGFLIDKPALVRSRPEADRLDLVATYAFLGCDFALACASRSRAVGPHPLRTVTRRPSLSSNAPISIAFAKACWLKFPSGRL